MECSTIMFGLSSLGTVFLICIVTLMAIGTAIIANWLIRKYWNPVEIVRFIDVPVDHEGKYLTPVPKKK
jgi:hypothetical protein